ncbi:MAG TPA: MmcQ/YjbR family DNA-binding protein [Allosphingosinicella sp.]|jgi:hypothetical protein
MAESEIERAARLAAGLPEVEVSTWYGTPALKVAGKGFVRVKEPGILVVMCPLGLKEALIEAEPEAFFETPHYSGWPAMLVRLGAIDDGGLKDRIEYAWREKAPKTLVKALEARG